MTTYTHNPDSLIRPEDSVVSRKSRVAVTGEMGRQEYNRAIHGFGRKADFDHMQYAERKIQQIITEAMFNCTAIIEAYHPKP